MLTGEKIIDFTGSLPDAELHARFGPPVWKSLRDRCDRKVVIILDRGEHMPKAEPFVVSDHINVTGANPLCGPNDPCGERFPIVNGIYITESGDDLLDKLPRGVAAGLKDGVLPSSSEMEELRTLGSDFCCYNLVPSMIVAAHAGWKVFGIVVPQGTKLTDDLVKRLTAK